MMNVPSDGSPATALPRILDRSVEQGDNGREATRSGSQASTRRIGLGGGCHWCTEAVFESLVGVQRVDQGWLAPAQRVEAFSEGVLVHFDTRIIDLETLIAVHLHTHSCTSDHALRTRYRTALYVESDEQAQRAGAAIELLQAEFDKPILTQVLPLGAFQASDARYLHYWQQDPERPFCRAFIAPKLQRVMQRFAKQVDRDRCAGRLET